MFNYRTWLLTGAGFLGIVVAFSAAAGAIWYHQDRTGMLQTLCEAGLPNLSRPAIVRPYYLGCNILGGKRRVKGILLSGFEAANFMTDELGPAPQYEGRSGPTWFTCNQFRGCDYGVGAQIERKTANVCGLYLVTIVVDGWPTVSAGPYGHLGIYRREFFMDRIVSAAPPPDSVVRHWKESLGFTEKECQEMAKSPL